ncbi:hypothetical protein BZG35_02450 [Brevundimonas sp. LM2]|uniref:hypothetical protein n=1 Tax=Brevundimonas sp. LM2 TaxID=1938605 RepID=UPI000983C35D|nr:hypothetical protein [Brevundimonas sp. LM2]AQR60634.1 hypothetical protein BZG35_02450 [Brevundimonas sp. LM2]
MLSMLLLLTAAPQSAIPAMPQRLIPPASPPSASMRVLGQASPICPSEFRRASDAAAPGAGLMWREGNEAVGLYKLLDRRVDGCPAPIVVNYRVPGSSALGREMGRETPAAPVIVPRR